MNVDFLQWAGCATGVLGSAVLAWRSRWSGWGFVAYLLSNAFWIAFGVLTRVPALVVMQCVFTVLSAIGVWCWLIAKRPAHEALPLSRGQLPVCDDGSLALVVLDEQRMKDRGIEYYGQALIVSRWGSKLKTTVDAMRLEYDDVIAWRDMAVTLAS